MNQEEPEEYEIQIHLPGLIKILGETLYADPEVSVREMIQNAHDATLRRVALDSGFTTPPRIDIDASAFRRTLSFRDNGDGMDKKEIQEFLAVVGKGLTEELRKALREKNRDIAERLIGRFGIGLLSAFIIGDSIEIRTRSWRQTPGEGYVWRCSGDARYTLTAAPRDEAGTEVVITLSERYARAFADETILTKTIKEYADFLSVPIHLNRSRLPVNEIDAPWHRGSSEPELKEYLVKRYPDIPPLEVIPVNHVEQDLAVAGVLYVPHHSVIGIRQYGEADVYISRAFVCRAHHGLLPVWAKFVRGVIDSPSLLPTLARDSVRKEANYDRVRSVLATTILSHLERLAVEQPQQFREIVTSHNMMIKAWALEDDSFFDMIRDLVLFDTDRGKMSIPQYLSRFQENTANGDLAQGSGGPKRRIYYFSDIGATQQKILFREMGLGVIDASYGAEEAFLKKYQARQPDVEVKKLDATEGHVFEPVSDPDRKWARLEDAFAAQKIIAKVVSFKPADIPAVLLPASDETSSARLRALVESTELSSELRGFFDDILKDKDLYRRGTLAGGAILHLNAASPIIEDLASQPVDEIHALVVRVLWNNAILFESHSVTPENALVIFQGNNMAVAELMAHYRKSRQLDQELTRKRLELAGARSELSRLRQDVLPIALLVGRVDTRHSDVFVMRPFRQEIEWVYKQCIKPACENRGLTAIHLADSAYTGVISEEIMHHIRECRILIADLTDANPNVMYEVGAAHMLGKGKQTILLAERTDRIPIDVALFHVFEYGRPEQAAALRDKIDEAIGEILRSARPVPVADEAVTAEGSERSTKIPPQ